MSDLWLCPDQIFDGERLQKGLALCVKDGRIAAVAAAPEGAETRKINGTIAPGFVDLQVNGGGGVLVNTTPTPEGIRAIVEAHQRLGTTAILPTVITDLPEVTEAAAEAVIAAFDPTGTRGALGIHIEGPHLSRAKRGTHKPEYIRPLDRRTMDLCRRLRDAGVPVLLTLAPEETEKGLIAELAEMGVKVSIGHSNATYEQVFEAIEEGAATFTHLYNAMSPIHHRAPGVVGAALNSGLPAGIIVDGIHVADPLVALSARARPAPDLLYIVSDAMPTVGGPDHFRLYEMDLRVVDGKLINTEGALAGAHISMAESVERAINTVGFTPEEVLRMAITIPAKTIGCPQAAGLYGRPLEDLVILDANWVTQGAPSL